MKDTTKPSPETPKEEGGEKEIEIKKLTQALMTALTHKLGRSPTPEELAEALRGDGGGEKQEEEAPSEPMPKILDYKIYYGLKQDPKSGAKVADPERPLFYENHDGTGWFDVEGADWVFDRPKMLDHLNSREVGQSDSARDLFDAIVFGVMDEDDYNMLASKQGVLDPRCERAYQLQKQAREQHAMLQELEKSIVSEDDCIPAGQSPVDNVKTMLEAAGAEGKQAVEEVFEPAGGGAKMVEQALGPGVEPRIRRWIREEIETVLNELMGEGPEEVAEVAPGE